MKQLLFIFCSIAILLVGCGGETTSAFSQNSSADTNQTEIKGDATQYAYAVTISINPEIRLYVDRDDKIVAAEYLNEDAKLHMMI